MNKQPIILYALLGAAIYYIYKLRQANKSLAEYCNNPSITFSETITENQ